MNERPRDTGYSNGVRRRYDMLSLIVRGRPGAKARPGVYSAGGVLRTRYLSEFSKLKSLLWMCDENAVIYKKFACLGHSLRSGPQAFVQVSPPFSMRVAVGETLKLLQHGGSQSPF
jgi:hypothetical protein